MTARSVIIVPKGIHGGPCLWNIPGEHWYFNYSLLTGAFSSVKHNIL